MSQKFSLKGMLRVYRDYLHSADMLALNNAAGGANPTCITNKLTSYDKEIEKAKAKAATETGRLPETLEALVADRDKFILENENTSGVKSYLSKNGLEIKNGKVSINTSNSVFSNNPKSSSQRANNSIFESKE